jgi:hypothetical protein
LSTLFYHLDNVYDVESDTTSQESQNVTPSHYLHYEQSTYEQDTDGPVVGHAETEG